MQTVEVGIEGYAPVVTIGITEQEKYRQVWERAEYRTVAPGEGIAPTFLQVVRPPQDAEVIDFGAGTGRGAMMLALMGSCVVHMLDFADNALDPEVREATISQPTRIKFTQHNLIRPIPISAEFGYCTDVLEHIPPNELRLVMFNILKSAQHVFFQISCEPDFYGPEILGQPLHLSVHPFEWWLDRFKDLGAVVHYSRNDVNTCIFYVSAWQDGSEIVKVGELNIADEVVLRNVKTNISKNFKQVTPHIANDMEVMIIGGSPSLAGQLETIRQMRAEGKKLITMNGAYNWAIENGLKPSAQIVVDARPHNARFTRQVIDDCKYLIASQCDPAVLEGLPLDRTFLWHTSAEAIRKELDEVYDIWYGVPGGSTVLLRALPMLYMLGFKKFHIFGCDSCLPSDTPNVHHAYSQPENDSDAIISIVVNGGKGPKRVFKCHAWMVSQAQEFMDLVKFFGQGIDLEVYGDGLISWIIKTAADIADEDLIEFT